MTCRLILASSSPRRRELMARLGGSFEVEDPDVDESVLPGESPAAHVRRLAVDKATAVADGKGDAVILAADTIVVLNDTIIGKPGSAREARLMLGVLAGRKHTVFTGVAVVSRGGRVIRAEVVSSRVSIAALSEKEIEDYVSTGEPLDKAGAYAVQGKGGRFVTEVEGSLTNVIGLPLRETCRLLAEAGCAVKLPGGKL